MTNIQSVLDIVLNLIKKGTGAKVADKELKNLEKSTEGATKQTKKFNLAQAAAKIGLAALAIGVAKQIPQMAQLGFKYKNAQIALAAYAGSAEEAEAITDAVTEAAGFAIDKFAAVTNATRLLSLGLATNAEEAAKLTKIAITLGATMGKDVQGAFEEFTLLLANQSILRLDTYGISGAKVREEMARLAAEFPELDRNTRFTNATLTIAEEKMVKLEAAGFEATSSIDRLGAKFGNLKLKVADWLLTELEAIEAIETTKDGFVKLTGVAGPLAQGLAEQADAADAAALAAEELTDANKDLATAEEEVILTTGGINELLQEQVFLSKALSLGMGGSLTKATEKWRDSLVSGEAATAELNAEQEELNLSFRLGQISAKDYAGKIDDLQKKHAELKDKSNELSISLQRTTAELIFQAAAADLDAETSLLLARRLGLVDEATFAVAQEAQRLRIQFDENAISAQEFAEEAGILLDAINSFTSKNIEITVDTFQARQNVSGLLSQIGVISAGFGQTIASSTLGFQEGGQFQIPDNGQRGDSVPVSFRAEPGEVVTITPNNGDGPNNVEINVNVSSDVDVAFFQQMLEDVL